MPDEAGDNFYRKIDGKREEQPVAYWENPQKVGLRFDKYRSASMIFWKSTAFVRQQDNPRLSVIIFTVEKERPWIQ